MSYFNEPARLATLSLIQEVNQLNRKVSERKGEQGPKNSIIIFRHFSQAHRPINPLEQASKKFIEYDMCSVVTFSFN